MGKEGVKTGWVNIPTKISWFIQYGVLNKGNKNHTLKTGGWLSNSGWWVHGHTKHSATELQVADSASPTHSSQSIQLWEHILELNLRSLKDHHVSKDRSHILPTVNHKHLIVAKIVAKTFDLVLIDAEPSALFLVGSHVTVVPDAWDWTFHKRSDDHLVIPADLCCLYRYGNMSNMVQNC